MKDDDKEDTKFVQKTVMSCYDQHQISHSMTAPMKDDDEEDTMLVQTTLDGFVKVFEFPDDVPYPVTKEQRDQLDDELNHWYLHCINLTRNPSEHDIWKENRIKKRFLAKIARAKYQKEFNERARGNVEQAELHKESSSDGCI